MKVKQLLLENFRTYKEFTRIDFDDLTAFIGKNDVGKSTILEALDIFFEGGVIKMDGSDLSSGATEGSEIMIGIVFDDFPDELIIDAEVKTSLRDELLLNKDGFFEVRKYYKPLKTKSTAKIFINAYHPVNDRLKELLSLRISDLKKLANELGIETSRYNATISSEIRREIRETQRPSMQLDEILIEINKEDTRTIYGQITKYFPIYALFQSDRKNVDKDSEVQNPMKAATKQVLKGIESELKAIEEQVQQKLVEISQRTVEKLREMNPEIASDLRPDFASDLKWDSIFTFDLISDDGIPLNKRGSGVRRLVLINFFRAEAERKKLEKDSPTVIYAIEEPETSQHPDWQTKLIEALKVLSSETPCQVFLTTHSPSLAGLINVDNLRYIHHDGNKVKVDFGSEEILYQIADELGMLPSLLPDNIDQLKVIVCVEGPTDVAFMKNLCRTCVEDVDVDLESDPRVLIIPLGGSILAHWVTNDYLRKLGKTEFHLYDRDDDCKYQCCCDEVNARGDGSCGCLTAKRTIENYAHPAVVKSIFTLPTDIVDFGDPNWVDIWDQTDVVKVVKTQKTLRPIIIKFDIANGANRIDKAHLKELRCYEEVRGWFVKINEMMQ